MPFMNILKWLIKIILTGLSFPLLIFPFSPRPACLFLRNLFRFGTYIRPRDYAFARASVRIERDLPYRERNVRGSRLDIISPAAVSDPPLPVLFWLHGGAYVGGDKSDVEGYAVQIAACGYIVANINYPLAPESPYPSGVRAVADAYRFICSRRIELNADLSSVYFAGDSAGAQMAAQFVTAQLDESYARAAGIGQVVPPDTIRGAALFCGLYDAEAYAARFDRRTPLSYLVRRVFWGVTADPNWRNGPALEEASVVRHIPRCGFPPVFLTDGNIGTFTEQGIAYAQALRECGTSVETVFYSRSSVFLPHEYQFLMHRSEAIKTFSRFIEFLERTKK